MKMRILVVMMVLMTAANAAMLVVNISISANAKVAGKDSFDLSSDFDFGTAVEQIVEDCKVDDEDIKC